MKPISITCILCGTLVFLAPMLHHFGAFALCAYALANTHLATLSINPPALDEGYRNGSLCFGLFLTLAGVVFGFLGRRVSEPIPTHKSIDPAMTKESHV